MVTSYTLSFGGELQCGQTLTQNNTTYTLSSHLDCEEGIFIKGKNITVDCQGHGLFSSSSSLGQGAGMEFSIVTSNCQKEGWKILCYDSSFLREEEINSGQGIGIEINKSSFVTIENCWVEGWEEGIVVENSKNTTLLGDVIVYNEGDGINFSKSKNTTIQDTVSEGNGISGFVEYKGSNTTIEDSYMIDNGDVDILLIAPKTLQFSLTNTEGNFSLTKEGGN